MMKTDGIPIIGRNALVTIIGHANKVPAKIDTGADGSAIWASNICINEAGHLQFTLFAKQSPFYTDETIVTDDFTAVKVKSSNGQVQIRYKVCLSIRLGGKRVKVLFNLSDRSANTFPILIGRRTLSGKFHVDVTLKEHQAPSVKRMRGRLHDELFRDPQAFHKKYHDTNK